MTTGSLHILLAIEDADSGARLIARLAPVLRQLQDARMTLYHVLKPMPRKLLEHGGSEAPDRERQLDTELKREQAEWLRQETAKESPVLHSARAKLCEAGVAADRIELRFESGDDIGECIVEQAKAGRYHAVALGHGGSHLRPGSVTRVVLNHAERLVVWLA